MVEPQTTNKLSEVNRQILEIKKKIQLSEGQRKALFEESETERKKNTEEIVKLKKEISRLVVELHENKSVAAKKRLGHKKFASGAYAEKPHEEACHLFDLQVIDKHKRLDLLKYAIKKRERHLVALGQTYRALNSTVEETKRPFERATRSLQNDIHAVEVQLREAVYVRERYALIRDNLRADGIKFDRKIDEIKRELEAQKADAARLQKIAQEAARMRSLARANLLQEEKIATCSATARERKTSEGKRLVSERKLELEKLEKRVFQGGKVSRPEPEGAENEDDDDQARSRLATPALNPLDALGEVFEKLKQMTGATCAKEVLERFDAQKNTKTRLVALRQSTEHEKKQREKLFESLQVALERHKYAEVRDAEKKSHGKAKALKEAIATLREKSRKTRALTEEKRANLTKVTQVIQGLHACVNPHAVLKERSASEVLREVHEALKKMLAQEEMLPEESEGVGDDEEMGLPAPYRGLVQKTPLPPQSGAPSPTPTQPPPGSDDEEEVPSRGYLKRQAQLVVDAKSRKKSLRFQRK